MPSPQARNSFDLMSDLEGVRTGRRLGWRPRGRLAAALAVAGLAASVATGTAGASAGADAGTGVGGHGYQATITRTSYGIPHITARDYGSLGYGYGFAFASDNLCTMADAYVTVEAQRSRYFGPNGVYTQVGPPAIDNLDSDVYWQYIIDSGAVSRLLGATSGPGALKPEIRQMIAGYVAGYNGYLASVGGSGGVPDPTCRGKSWVKPITTLDAYLRMYQLVDISGGAGDPASIAAAQPPTAAPASATALAPAGPASADSAALTAQARAVAAAPPGTPGLPTSAQVQALAQRLATDRSAAPGSNALAVGSGGTRDHQAGILLGNPHFPWDGPERFYQVQMTIPGALNVEGATLYGEPVVVIGFNSSVAWSHTDTPSFTLTPYQLTLVPGHPTEYVVDGHAVAMTSRTVTVLSQSPTGALEPVRRTLWFSRWGPVTRDLLGLPLDWTDTSAVAVADADATNFRFLNDAFTTDQATSTADILAGLKHYEGMPWVDTVAADASGHALYSDIGSFPHVTDAEAQRCDTAIGAILFQEAGFPILHVDCVRSPLDDGVE